MNNELRDTLGMPKCLMCENKDYGWYEVLRDNCGKSPEETIETLCDVHQDIFKEQLQKEIKK